MGLIEISGNKSFWRGVDYYNNKMVISWEECGDDGYKGIVLGSHKERYRGT